VSNWRLKVWHAAFLACLLLWGCGAPVGGDSEDLDNLSARARSFQGLQSLNRNAEGTFVLRWRSLDDRLATYGIFRALEGEKIDLEGAPYETTLDNYYVYVPEDPRGEPPICFIVRVVSIAGDENKGQFCTPDTRQVFGGVQTLERQGDGSYILGWEALEKETFYHVFRFRRADPRSYDTPLVIVSSNYWETVLPPRGTTYCYAVVPEEDLEFILEGVEIPELCTEDEEPIIFGGITMTSAVDATSSRLEWVNPDNPAIIGFIVYRGSSLKEQVESDAFAGVELVPGPISGEQIIPSDASQVIITGLVGDNHLFTVRAVDRFGREDTNIATWPADVAD
jgi:hypothetical protein